MRSRRETLADILRENDLQAREVAARLRVSKVQVSVLVNGVRDASDDLIRKLSRAMRIPFERGWRAYWQGVKVRSLRRARLAEKNLRARRPG